MTVLKARVGGQWVAVGGVGTGEVWVGPDDPISTNPGTELWYDTDASPTLPGMWQSWVPTLTQGVGVGVTVNSARYVRIGNTIIGNFFLTATSSGTAGSVIFLSRPATGRSYAGGIVGLGTSYVNIGSTGQMMLTIVDAAGTDLRFIRNDNANVANYYGTDPAVGIVSGNMLGGSFMYEAL